MASILNDDYKYYLLKDHGQEEAIFSSVEGSAGVLYVQTFKKTRTGWNDLGYLTLDDGSFGDGIGYRTYTDEVTGKDKFLMQLCGKTYITLTYYNSQTDQYENPSTYLWINGQKSDIPNSDADFNNYSRWLTDIEEGHKTCDAKGIAYERKQFQSTYQKSAYGFAANALESYLIKCKNKIDNQTFLWLKNDLALAKIKSSAEGSCDANSIFDEIKTSQAFKQASPRLKNAVAYNQKLCKEAEAGGVRSS